MTTIYRGVVYIIYITVLNMTTTVTKLVTAGAMFGVAWGYLSKLTIFSGAKYYVSQQLAQMQVHHYNKYHIEQAAKQNPRFKKLVAQIFEDYERDVKFKKWCWITNGTAWMCIGNNEGTCSQQKFGGIFPPIASLAHMVNPCDKWTEDKTWETPWLALINGYGKSYFSDLEYYVLQLEALEQDLALMKF